MPSAAVTRLKATIGRRWPAPAAGLLALALYARTLAPGLTWAHQGADGGDLLAAALTAGVPHPTGYPTYQLLLRSAIALLPGEPARAGNWLSALAAACAVAVLTDLARRVLAAGWSARADCYGPVALATGLTWAASPLLWSQAVITEVYTVHALAVVFILWLLWRWHAARLAGWPAHGWLAAASLAWGLGLGNHLSLALMAPAVVVWIRSGLVTPASGQEGRRTLTQDHGPGQAPASGSLRSLLSARPWGMLLAGLALGLSVYIYLPLAAAAGPAINWGDPSTLTGFWWTISGRAYAALFLGMPPGDLLARLAAWARMAVWELGGGPWGLLLALAGLWWTDRHQHRWWQTTGLIALGYTLYSLAYRTADSYVYLLPVWAMAALWLAAGLGWLIAAVSGRAPAPAPADATRGQRRTETDENLTTDSSPTRRGEEGAPPSLAGKRAGGLGTIFRIDTCGTTADDNLRRSGFSRSVWPRTAEVATTKEGIFRTAFLLIMLLPVLAVLANWRANDLSHDSAARDFVAAALAEAEPGALILTAGDRTTFALWYAVYGLKQRQDVIPLNVHLYEFEWYRLSLHRHHPDLAQLADVCTTVTPLAQLVEQALAGRPVYRAEPLELTLPDTQETPAGVLVRIRPAS